MQATALPTHSKAGARLRICTVRMVTDHPHWRSGHGAHHLSLGTHISPFGRTARSAGVAKHKLMDQQVSLRANSVKSTRLLRNSQPKLVSPPHTKMYTHTHSGSGTYTLHTTLPHQPCGNAP
jgi:hypothetical protein